MRAISLWQPWATAVVLGVKKIETRSWPTDYRGPLAIHAAKRWAKDQRDFATTERALGRLPDRLPFGAIVGVVTLADCQPTEELELTIGAIERLYGNYDRGRFGWLLTNACALVDPVPCVGRQSFFSIDDGLLP